MAMAGYRRVNYYELCRLCTSSEGTKMHIFREEGRRRQLPTKIQICLPVQVCEDDSLPKIICSHCVEKLESFYDFRESCVNAESMLESYFTSLRYSDDFSREGKVYVKEGSPPKKKPSEIESFGKNSSKGSVIGAPDGLSSLVQAAGIQIVSDVDGTRVQQYKCALQMPSGTPGPIVMENSVATPAEAEARYSYEACGTSSPHLSDASPGATTATSVETHQAKLEDGSTQCNETDFKNNGMTRHHQTSADSSDEGEVVEPHHQQQLQPVAFAAGIPGQEMLLHFSFKQERDAVLRSDEQTALQRTSIAQIGEFLRMKNANIGDNGVQTAVVELPSSPLRPCLQCGKSFSNLELQNHVPCHQDPLSELPLEKGNLNGGTIACDVCNKLFKRKEHLFQHRKLHTGERPYICTSCGKAFSRKEHLVRHTVSHTGQKAHACEMCGKSFSRKDNLHKHRKTHGIAGPYCCEMCGKSFVVKHNYVMHKSSHGCSGSVSDDVGGASLDTSLPYKCDICNKGFAMKQYLITHRQRHRSKGARANAASASNSVSVASAIPVVPSVNIPSVTSPSQSVTVNPSQQPATTTTGQNTAALPVSSCDSTLGTSSAGNSTVAVAAVPASSSTSHNSQSPSSQQQQSSLQQSEPQQQQQPQPQRQQSQQQHQDDPTQQTPQTSQQQSTVQLDPIALTHNASLTALSNSPLLAPGLLQHVSAAGVSGSSVNPTMAIHVSSSAATAYLCNPSNELLETYRRLHST